MEGEKISLEAVEALIVDTLEKSRSTTQGFIHLLGSAAPGVTNAGEARIAAFKVYVERRVAASHALVDKLLRTTDFKQALRIQFEYFQSELRAAVDHTSEPGVKAASHSANQRAERH
jgi:hypothetical protein